MLKEGSSKPLAPEAALTERDERDPANSGRSDAGVPVTPEPAEPFPADEQPYVFRPAEFRPAVFIPAHPPHHADAGPAAAMGAHPVPQTAPAAAAKVDDSPWRRTVSRAAEEVVAWMKTVISAAVYATLIVTFGFQVARVEGQSMVPTLEDQDRLIVNKWKYHWSDPQIGDVVMLYYPEEPEKSFVKRIVAEAGDTIRGEGGKVYRNEVPINDDFIPEEYRDYTTWGPYVVKKGYYFVMGDHRNNSSDSRYWGDVPKRYIIGKVQLRWWPLNHAKIF
jgi:signal peptidase I